MNHSLAQRSAAEAVGTFILVFAGTGAIVVNRETGGVITHAGVALTFGLTVFALVQMLGDISGAHLNPAVTTGLATARRFPAGETPHYISAQCLGALLASSLMRFLFPADTTLGATIPAGPPLRSFILEMVLSSILMLAILRASTGSPDKVALAGATIGAIIGLEAMFAGPVCGASMNPARSLAPAVVSGQCSGLWIYLAAPFSGAVAGVFADRALGGGRLARGERD